MRRSLSQVRDVGRYVLHLKGDVFLRAGFRRRVRRAFATGRSGQSGRALRDGCTTSPMSGSGSVTDVCRCCCVWKTRPRAAAGSRTYGARMPALAGAPQIAIFGTSAAVAHRNTVRADHGTRPMVFCG